MPYLRLETNVSLPREGCLELCKELTTLLAAGTYSTAQHSAAQYVPMTRTFGFSVVGLHKATAATAAAHGVTMAAVAVVVAVGLQCV